MEDILIKHQIKNNAEYYLQQGIEYTNELGDSESLIEIKHKLQKAKDELSTYIKTTEQTIVDAYVAIGLNETDVVLAKNNTNLSGYISFYVVNPFMYNEQLLEIDKDHLRWRPLSLINLK